MPTYRLIYGTTGLLSVTDASGAEVPYSPHFLDIWETDEDRADEIAFFERDMPSSACPLVLLLDGRKLIESKTLTRDVTFEEVIDENHPVLALMPDWEGA